MSYHLVMPTDSALIISNLAEIINRLWGHLTPGGRLYPAPLEQEIFVIAWGDDEPRNMQQMRGYQLAGFNEPGNWTCVIILGVSLEQDLWELDAEFERTPYPSELLWGPGKPLDALTWLRAMQPVTNSAEYLDRLFALRIHNGQVSLPRRPEVVLALPPDQRDGAWFLIRADFPNDAFYHVRHVNEEVKCGDPNPHIRQLPGGTVITSPPIPRCMVECVFDGNWPDLVDMLGGRFSITEPAVLSEVKVPSRWRMALHVETE
jgi:hypothetical protein